MNPHSFNGLVLKVYSLSTYCVGFAAKYRLSLEDGIATY